MPRLTAALAACAAFLSPLNARSQTPVLPKADAAVQSETLLLRWIKPSEFVQQLMPAGEDGSRTLLMPGLLRMSTDDAKKRVVMQGSEKALANVREIALLLDVKRRQIFLSARLLRVPADTDVPTAFGVGDAPRLRGVVVTTASAKTENNQPALLYAIGDGRLFHVKLTPHVNGGDSVTVWMEVGDNSEPTKRNSEVHRASSGTPMLAASQPIAGLNNTKYYWEITPVVPPRLSDAQTNNAQTAAPKNPTLIAKRK